MATSHLHNLGNMVKERAKMTKANSNATDNRCVKCGSAKLINGEFEGYGVGGVFRVKGKILKQPVVATACKDCGCIFNLKLKNPENIK